MKNTYAKKIKKNLFNEIHEMSLYPSLFVNNPDTDFTRNRKLNFETFLKFTLSMEGGSVRKELLDYFSFSVDTATVSAYNQQRSKVLPEAFEYLFHEFTSTLENQKLYNGYRLFACDGSDINIPRNPKDEDTYFQSFPTDRGFNQLHLNAFYDLCNRNYIDAIIQPARKEHEIKACIDMIDRSAYQKNVILVADRGYENYNLFAHAKAKGWKFVIRVKDKNSNGIVSGLKISDKESFDKEFSYQLTRRYTKEIRTHPEKYRYLTVAQNFDYLPLGSVDSYPMNFRVVRFLISKDTYETIITNLDKDEFSIMKIKEIYALRWGIETSFRELKYAIGLSNFHAKKVAYIKQEIFARLTLYNFCQAITTKVVIKQQKKTKYSYQVNFTTAINICKYFLKYKKDKKPPNVEMLIQKNLLPIRPGRQDPRKVRPQKTVSFLYRIA
jgi:hypothetical protein